MKILFLLIIILSLGCKNTRHLSLAETSTLIELRKDKNDNFSTFNDRSIFSEKKSFSMMNDDGRELLISKPDSVPQILIKVFPDVEFYYSQDFKMKKSPKQLMCRYKLYGYDPFFYFNTLIDRMKYNYPVIMEDKYTALLKLLEGVQFKVWVKSVSDCDQRTHLRVLPMNKKLEAFVNGRLKTYLLYVKDGRINYLTTLKNKSYTVFKVEEVTYEYDKR